MVKLKNFGVVIYLFLYYWVFVAVCLLYDNAGYYARRFLNFSFFSGEYYVSIFIILVSLILFILSIVYSIKNNNDYKSKNLTQKNLLYKYAIGVGSIIVLGSLAVYIWKIAGINMLFFVFVVIPFVMYSISMYLLYCTTVYIYTSEKFKNSDIYKFFKEFPVNQPVGFMVVVLAFSLVVFISMEIYNINIEKLVTVFFAMFWLFSLYFITVEFSKFVQRQIEENEIAVSERVKSESFKTELITNVSHDIKTPLTSIINYVDIIQKLDIDNDELKKYSEILQKKSFRLKNLIEDLIEASKAGTGNINMNLEKINFSELISQVYGEFDENSELNKLDFITDMPIEAVVINADGRYLWRVLENVYGNAIKYSMSGTRVYTTLKNQNGVAEFTLQNISSQPLNITPDELMEQFVRGDRSRLTEGSGLGLYIAKNIVENMYGDFEVDISGDAFRVYIKFDIEDE